ncbi:MAG: T9SS type A sorting domain-containing protein [Bacteroidales bacterium]|nr:T9SS type A sorting domain-containing protein [Bacteroidales bacterium]
MKIRSLLLIVLLGAFAVARADGEHWTWNPYQYGDNASFIAVITIDSVEQRSDQLEIAAFYEDECRGSIICVYVPQKDRYFAYLTVNGENNMVMTFRLYDHGTETEIDADCDNTYTFVANQFQGTPSNPFVFAFTSNFQGQVFNGNVNNSWSEAGNWSGNALPGVNDNILIGASCNIDADVEVANLTVGNQAVLTIEPGKSLSVTGTLTNTVASNLVIKDGAQLVNASANVAATAEKDIIAYGTDNPGGWYTLSSPMDDMAIAGSDFLTPEYDLYRFNETNLTNEEWENYKAGMFDIFENGRGYLYANNNTFSPAFTGTLNNADVSYDLTLTDRPDDDLDGFNLIGNPFPHVIYKGMGGAINDNRLASGFYTLTNEGAWHVHTYEEAIMPGQGFLVKTTAATSLDIAKTTAVATAESSAKDETGRLNLKVGGDNGQDRTFAYFSQGIGLEKLNNFNGSLPSLYVTLDETDYAIAHVGAECESLELGLRSGQSGDFTLSVDVEGLCLGYLHLIDRIAGTDTDLLQQPDYGFTATGQEDEARFELVFMETTVIEETDGDVPFAFVRNGEIVIMDVETCHGASLQIVDMTGRTMLCRDGVHTVSTEGMAPGVYVLRMIEESKVRTQKIFIK